MQKFEKANFNIANYDETDNIICTNGSIGA